MSLFRVLASAVVLFSMAQAARIRLDIQEQQQKHQLDIQHTDPDEVAAVTVCEDDAIWEKIMAAPDVGSIRGIPWKEISDSINDYLSNEAVLIGSLESEVENLRQEIERKKAAEVSEIFSDEQIQTLITGSTSAEGSFGSVENAKTSACGKPGKRPRVPFDSMEKATDHIVSLAKPLLSTGEFKSEKKKFLTVCKSFLDAGEDDLENYCGEVCFELAEVVQRLSDQHSNAKKSTAKLEKTLAEKNLELLEAKKRGSQCQKSKQNIEGFQVYLESLDTEISARHKAVRKAELDLDNAQWALDDLEKKLEDQKQLVSDAAALLTGTQKTVQEAREALAAVQKDEDQFIEQIGAAKNQLSELREELANMKSAIDAILWIKKYVSATALMMGYYVDVTVREPVREIGLVEETNVWDYFSENVASEQCSTSFKYHLTDFHQYCTGPAMAAFEKIKHFVDLTPLCKLGEETKIATEGDTGVQTRIGLITRDLKDVQSWLDPFKGTDMTAEKETAKVEKGEPEGLRQVMGVYGNTQFYKHYMKEWKVEKGKFHELLKQLVMKMQLLEKDVLQEEDLLKDLAGALQVTANAREEAQAKLDVALANEEAALQGKQQLEEAMASLESNIGESRNMLADLEQVLKQALQLYKKARETLITEHSAHKNGIMALTEVHVSALSD